MNDEQPTYVWTYDPSVGLEADGPTVTFRGEPIPAVKVRSWLGTPFASASAGAARTTYRPEVRYLCGDPDCCENGCPVVECTVCGNRWPCADYRANHTEAQIARQARWVDRVTSRPW